MAPFKRARCDTEGPEDQPSNHQGETKKSKTAHNEANPIKPRPPKNKDEEQLLNRLDQEAYDEIVNYVKTYARNSCVNLCARRHFFNTFYAKNVDDEYPEALGPIQSPASKTDIVQRRKVGPWYFTGFEKYQGHRQRYPKKWPYLYEAGEENDGGNDGGNVGGLAPLFPTQEADKPTSSDSNGPARSNRNPNFWYLSPSQMEEEIKRNELKITNLIEEHHKMIEKESATLEVQKAALEVKKKFERLCG